MLNWVLIVAAGRYTKTGSGRLHTDYAVRLRSERHVLIAADIGDERKRRGDSLPIGIAGAVLCESRVSEASVVDAHVRGVMALLSERGGVGSLVDKPWHCGITHVLLLAGRGGGCWGV